MRAFSPSNMSTIVLGTYIELRIKKFFLLTNNVYAPTNESALPGRKYRRIKVLTPTLLIYWLCQKFCVRKKGKANFWFEVNDIMYGTGTVPYVLKFK